jgi:hypothetical protein
VLSQHEEIIKLAVGDVLVADARRAAASHNRFTSPEESAAASTKNARAGAASRSAREAAERQLTAKDQARNRAGYCRRAAAAGSLSGEAPGRNRLASVAMCSRQTHSNSTFAGLGFANRPVNCLLLSVSTSDGTP